MRRTPRISTCRRGRPGTAPGLPEAILFESRRHGGFSHHGVVALLGFSRRDVADRLQQPAIVEPVHPFERCELDGFHGPPRSPSMDNLGLVETIDGFGEGIVVTIANTADRRLNACFRQALGIPDREVLAASVAVMHEPATMRRPPVMESLLERIENEARMRGS